MGHPPGRGDTHGQATTPDVPSVTSRLSMGSQGFCPGSRPILLGYEEGRGNVSPSPAPAALTRMKRHSLANFWCSWMVEKTDSTRQLKTRRNLQGQSVSGATGTARPHSQPEPPQSRPPQVLAEPLGARFVP